MNEVNKHGSACSLVSLEANEEMFGTAPTVDVWFLLEYRGHWSGSAFRDSKIPASVKARINLHLESYPNSRLQLIKKKKRSGGEIKFYMALSHETRPRLYELTLDGYEDLLELDIDSILKGDQYLREEPLSIVCTNGEYDTCCGKYGMPVYLDVAGGVNGSDTWQTTHIGGHRFASTFVCLPHGVYYGRVREGGQADRIIDEYRNRNINTRYYRGRSCYSAEAQAGEYFLRKETGRYGISDYIFERMETSDNKSNITFISKPDGMAYNVKIMEYNNTATIIKSCGDTGSSVPTYRLIDLSSG